MEFIIVSILKENGKEVRDLEVPANLPVKEWYEGLLIALDLHRHLFNENAIECKIKAYNPSMQGEREISINRSLNEAGVKNGDWLLIKVPSYAGKQTMPSKGPLKGWRKLSIPTGKNRQEKEEFPEWMKKPLDD